jgi:hypothetical protein
VGAFGYLMEPELLPVASIDLTTRMDSWSATLPNTTCLLSSQEVTTVVMKNCEPLLRRVSHARWTRQREAYVLGPALAMDRRKGALCLSLKFSSANFSP